MVLTPYSKQLYSQHYILRVVSPCGLTTFEKTRFRIFLKTIKMDLRLFKFWVRWTYDYLDFRSNGLTTLLF